MSRRVSRRAALKTIGAAGAGFAVSGGVIRGQDAAITIAGRPVEIAVAPVSAMTVRVTVRPLESGTPVALATTGALVTDTFGPAAATARAAKSLARVRAGGLAVRYTDGPPTIHVETTNGEVVQRLVLAADAPGMSFLLPRGPLLGLGEGGVQFDRKGHVDQMRNGQGGFQLATHGTRAPVQWLIGTSEGWAMFIHQPYGTFDLTGAEGKFALPANAQSAAFLPLDVFVVHSSDPKTIMREYARITGLPELPARWTFGYQQSSRTLHGQEEILRVARTFREKKLPCDALIYLGTEFTPSGWNTRNGEFTWHATNFPDPKKIIDELHAQHFKVVTHIVIEGRRLLGRVSDPCTAPPIPPGRDGNSWPPERQVSCYWPAHKPLMDLGVDAFWPDQGDGYDGPSRFNRHRMYWEGQQLYRPNVRPYALHRNASPGIQRYGGFIWSGDVQTRWETLKTHVPVAINTALSGLPYWGTDIGGFVPTTDYTGELHVRWFQFGAFNPLFRAHGRLWYLRLPWGWGLPESGPAGDTNFRVVPEEMNNAQVEPILKKYLELRYRLMPYLYTAVKDGCETGMPVIRALWLHAPDDPAAVARGDEYLWGPDMLVAPVVEKGATSRRLYLPKGTWIDFWNDERVEGGREIDRPVDLATTPLYVRAGAVIPMDPIRQYTDEPVNEPMTLVIYPGANGSSSWYEDDGRTFDYRRGEAMRVQMAWEDRTRRLTLELASGSKMQAPTKRLLNVRVAGSPAARSIAFAGERVTIQL